MDIGGLVIYDERSLHWCMADVSISANVPFLLMLSEVSP